MHTWVDGGRAIGCIRLAHGAGEAERFAAAELSDYFTQMSSVALPIVHGLRQRDEPSIIILDATRPANRAYLGDLPIDDLRDDGYLIQSVGDDLFITSNEPFGVVFGVYQYLSRVLGCRFLDYAPDGEDIPQLKTVTHDAVAMLRNPRLTYRGMQMAYSPQRIDWMAKNGFNWVRMGNDHDLDWWDAKLKVLAPHYRKRGIRITFGHHMFRMILPGPMYLEDHPDFFNLVDGEPKPQGQFYWSLRNRTALDEVVWRLTRFLRAHPEVEQLDFWPNDGRFDLAPEDYEALAGEPMPGEGDWTKSASGHTEFGRLGDPRKAKVYALLAKHVAEQLGKVFPNLEIILAAYVDLTQPCPEVELPSNVSCTVAMYWRCYRHTAIDRSCIYNDQYLTILDDWLSLGFAGRLYVSEYYMGMGCHASLPYPIVTTLFREWPALMDKGIVGGKVNTGREVDTGVVPYNLNYLAFQAIAWNDAADAETFIEQYCRDFFARAWQPMRDLYLLWEQAAQQAEHTQPGIDRFFLLFDDDTVQQSQTLIDAASLAADDDRIASRVRRVEQLLDYARRALPVSRLLYEREQREIAGESTAELDAQLVPPLQAMTDHFQSLAALKQNIVAVVEPNEWMKLGDVKSKPDPWARALSRITNATEAAADFEPDILRAARGK